MTGKEASEALAALTSFRERAVYAHTCYNEWVVNPNKFHRAIGIWKNECIKLHRDSLAHPDGKYEFPETADWMLLRDNSQVVEEWKK